MADLILTAGMDDRGAKAGFAGLRQEAQSFKTMLGTIGTYAGALLGVAGVAGAVNQLRTSFQGMVKDVAATEKMLATVARRGDATAETIGRIDARIRSLTLSSRLGDTEITDAFTDLVQLTGDVEGSIKNLDLVLDEAAASGKGLSEVTKTVAFVMKGELERAGELSTGVKVLARNHRELIGTAEGAATAISTMRNEVRGADADLRNTAQGGLDAFHKGWSELWEEFTKANTGTGVLGFLGQIGDKMYELAHNPFFAQMSQLSRDMLLGPLQYLNDPSKMAQRPEFQALNAFLSGGPRASMVTDPNGMSHIQVQWRTYAQDRNLQMARAGLMPWQNPSGPGIGPNPALMGELAPPDLYAQFWAQAHAEGAAATLGNWTSRPMRPRTRVRGFASGDFNRFFDEQHRTDNPKAAQLLADDARMRQQWQEGIRSATETGLTLAIQGGNWAQAFKDIITQSLVSAFAEAFSKKLTNWLFSAAATAGGGPIAGGLSGIFNGIGDGNSSVRFAAMASVRRAAARG